MDNPAEVVKCDYCGAIIDDLESENRIAVFGGGVDMYIGQRMVLDDWVHNNWCCADCFLADIRRFLSKFVSVEGKGNE